MNANYTPYINAARKVVANELVPSQPSSDFINKIEEKLSVEGKLMRLEEIFDNTTQSIIDKLPTKDASELPRYGAIESVFANAFEKSLLWLYNPCNANGIESNKVSDFEQKYLIEKLIIYVSAKVLEAKELAEPLHAGLG